MSKCLLAVIAFMPLAACSGEPLSPADPTENFGLAVRSNMEAQIIADEGEVQTLGPAPGERRALAAGRYQTDQVEQPVELYTRDE